MSTVKTPQLIRDNDKDGSSTVLSDTEFMKQAQKQMSDLILNIHKSNDTEAVFNDSADILELLNMFFIKSNIDAKKVFEFAEEKRKTHGTFSCKFVNNNKE